MIDGHWLPHGFSQQHPAVLRCDHLSHCQVLVDDQIKAQAVFGEIQISDRLGQVPRRLTFALQGTFITGNNDGIDDIQKQFGTTRWSDKLHFLESNLQVVLISFVLLIFSIFVIAKYGVPYTAEKISKRIPQELLTIIENSTLEQLDEGYLKPSALSIERQSELTDYFASFETANRQVLFREGEEFIGANAFALPNKTIVFTDQLIALAEHDEELLSIYFHETGHILHRHGIRAVLQSSSIALFITFISGDGSGIAEIVYAIPILLAHSAYSRRFETESDDHAFEQMVANDIPLHRFADIMSRLESEHRAKEAEESEGQKNSSAKQVTNYFSSHPSTDERILRFSNP